MSGAEALDAALTLARQSGPHTFVVDVDAPVLAEPDHRHLERSLRLRVGDALTVSDGHGRWRSCRFGDTLEIAGDVAEVPRFDPEIAIGFALVKGGRPETIVQKLTELGVDRIIPFRADRSVVVWDEAKAQKNAARLDRVAREAAMQSHRAWLPTVEPVASFAELAVRPNVARADLVGDEPTSGQLLLIGPEGGWSESERSAVSASVLFAPHVLRSETAAIAACTLLSSRRFSHLGG